MSPRYKSTFSTFSIGKGDTISLDGADILVISGKSSLDDSFEVQEGGIWRLVDSRQSVVITSGSNVSVRATNSPMVVSVERKVLDYVAGTEGEKLPLVSFTTSPGGGVELTVAGEAYDPLAISPYYHFHGFAGGQVVGDGFLYDQASVNHGSLGADLENATAWALPGFLSLAAPTPMAPRTDVALPPISFDYSAGEKLLVWWLAKASAPAATMSFCGDGNGTVRPGLRIRANAAGSFDIALHSISFPARYSPSSSAVAFDGTLHSAGVLIDGESKKYGMWVDESATHPAGQAGYSTLASGGEADTRTASQFYIGSAGTTEGIAASVRAFVVIRLPPGKACPSIALVTDIFKRFRASPGCVLSQGAL